MLEGQLDRLIGRRSLATDLASAAFKRRPNLTANASMIIGDNHPDTAFGYHVTVTTLPWPETAATSK